MTRTAVVIGSTLVAGLLTALLLVSGRVLVAVTVRGRSMEPAYHDGDRVIVLRGARFRRGQAVVVERYASGLTWSRPPLPSGAGSAAVEGRGWLIKRVAAAPGDKKS